MINSVQNNFAFLILVTGGIFLFEVASLPVSQTNFETMNNKPKEWVKIPVKKDKSLSPSKRYSIMEKLGEGAFGYVMKAKDNTTGTFVALKTVPLKHVYADERSIIYENEQMGIKRGNELMPNHIFRELKSLQHLEGHPNIIK